MQKIAVSRTGASVGELLLGALRYPLRGTALVTCLILAGVYLATALPGLLGRLVALAFWVMLWRYGAACLLHAANGYADPPGMGVEESTRVGVILTVIHLVVVACATAGVVYNIPSMVVLAMVLGFALPAIDMSLAFDGDLATALNPVTWWRTMGRFGFHYFIPLGLNLLTFALVVLVSTWMRLHLPAVLALPLYGYAVACLVIMNFQLMGAMVHEQHEDLGMQPEAAVIAQRSGQDADDLFVVRMDQLAETDPEAALDQFVARLQHRAAPATIHRAYRDLMRKRGMREGLMVHGQVWIAALVANAEERRALGVVQECLELDASFIPDDPVTALPLIDLASRIGMSQLALQMSRSYLRQWPHSPETPRVGLLAARLLGDQPNRGTEGVVLLGKLMRAFPEDPLRPDMEALAKRLSG
ncbi:MULTISPECIES: hypothetical protein [Dyella]|uniref:Uncharacterized protein n=2 Tax=Dyella TaxID=231454 RepID=A0A4R0YNK9_9GAMM|nr:MULTISPECIES: hypothetical protein [Dyella]TBR37015.1 hypothetical protein EYV96_14060 [Dyella terrae]TCI07896.1 hypothetical protein EZM97_24810 [Dyella soli]